MSNTNEMFELYDAETKLRNYVSNFLNGLRNITGDEYEIQLDETGAICIVKVDKRRVKFSVVINPFEVFHSFNAVVAILDDIFSYEIKIIKDKYNTSPVSFFNVYRADNEYFVEVKCDLTNGMYLLNVKLPTDMIKAIEKFSLVYRKVDKCELFTYEGIWEEYMLVKEFLHYIMDSKELQNLTPGLKCI